MNPSPRTRLYVPDAGRPHLILTDPDSLGVRKTLRLQTDDVLACFNGDGMKYFYRVEDSSRNRLQLSFLESAVNPADEIPLTWIFLAATKGKTKDRMARDLPPLGATRLVFYRADHSVCLPSLDAQPRLQKIAIEACRQCGRSAIPIVEVMNDPLSIVYERESIDPIHSLLFWESMNPSDDWRQNQYAETAALIFGPEGGFSEEEIRWFQSRNIPLASMGRRILRTELAATVGTTLVQSHRRIL